MMIILTWLVLLHIPPTIILNVRILTRYRVSPKKLVLINKTDIPLQMCQLLLLVTARNCEIPLHKVHQNKKQKKKKIVIFKTNHNFYRNLTLVGGYVVFTLIISLMSCEITQKILKINNLTVYHI